MHRHRSPLIVALVILAPTAAARPSLGAGAEVDARVDALLGRLKLEEKLGQLQQLACDARSGRLLDGQDDLIREGRVGSLYEVRGARNVNEVQRIAVEESHAKVPILIGFDVIHGYRTIF